MQKALTCVVALAFAFVSLLPVVARPAQADDLAEALLLPELFEIMAAEGRRSVLADDAVPLQGPALARFQADVEAIYAPEQMLADFVAALDDNLRPMPEVRADTIAFAQSELGREIMRLEISAREALLDDDVDYVARTVLEEARSDTARAQDRARLADVRARIAANDLLELNVSLGLNTSFAYYRGMMKENAVSGLNAETLLQLVWAQEPDIRADIEDWIESYFLMAYQPLDAEEMQALLDYAETPLARAFNQAMFRAFDTVFTDISHRLGRVLGQRMTAEEL